MRVLGIDASLTECGWAVLDSELLDKAKLVEFGTIKSKQRGMERVADIMTTLKQKGLACSVVAIEGYSYGAVGRAIYQIGELGGIIRFHFWCTQTPVFVYPVFTWCKVITGKGNLSKNARPVPIFERWGVKGNHNAVEAWAVGRTHLIRMCEKDTWTKFQAEAFQTLDKGVEEAVS